MRWFIILIIIVIAVFYFLGNQEPAKKSAPPASQAAATPAPEPASTPAASAAPATPAASRAAALIPRFQAAARQTGVQLRNVQMQPGGAWVFIAWTGDNAALGGDFLDECLKQGIISNFDENKTKPGMSMENGVQVHTTQFFVYPN